MTRQSIMNYPVELDNIKINVIPALDAAMFA